MALHPTRTGRFRPAPRWVCVAMVTRSPRALTAALGLLGTLSAGCAAAGAPTVAEIAQRFAGDLARHDGISACAMLTDEARRGTETFGRDCPSQLATLPTPGAVQHVEVWGSGAQVRLSGDTLFLMRFPDGWRVSAAGCRPQADAPYDCEVQG